MILLYRILTLLIYPFLFVFVYYRKFIKKEDKKRFKEKILISNFNVDRKKNINLIWFHAASIGEFKSILPIIKRLDTLPQNLEFLITTNTYSSGKLAKEELKKFKNVHHRFFPFDVEFLIKNFLEKWKPNKILLVDSEIWPNLIINANKLNIPIALINARITPKSFKRWIRFPKVAKKIFSMFELCLASNLETKKFLEKLSAKNIYFHGNIKLIDNINEQNIENVNNFFIKKRFWIAASTHNGEEIFSLKAHAEIRKKYNDIVTVLAPRHIDRAHYIKELSEGLGFNTQLLNKNEKILEGKEIIIVNSFGDLNIYFKFAKSVFIGKSIIKKLKNDSGQNPIDAAKLNCKIYHGPFVNNFKDIYEILKINNISKEIFSYKELSDNLIDDLEYPFKEDKRISNSINNLGKKTLADTMERINKFIFNDFK